MTPLVGVDQSLASPATHDAGVGDTSVSVYGTVTRDVPMPSVHTGVSGLASIYPSRLRIDVSYPAFAGTSTMLYGGSMPVPGMQPFAPEELQPRLGNMPGLYLYRASNENFYQYGGPVRYVAEGEAPGANPATTAEYTPDAGQGGQQSLSGPTPQAPVIHHNQLSGAELWHYVGAATPYVEIKHVDGTIARFDSFWSGSGTRSLWRLSETRDPYDNLTTYTYDSLLRLIDIVFPSGITQHFDYAPNWGQSWQGTSRIEISYTQTIGTTTTPLPDLTWGLAFYQGALPHYGGKLYRTYSAPRSVLQDQVAPGQPYALNANPTVVGQVVTELVYDVSGRTMTEWQWVHTGTPFAQQTTSPPALQSVPVLQTAYFASGFDAERVQATTVLPTSALATYAYPAAQRQGALAELLPEDEFTMRAIEVTEHFGANPGTVRRYEFGSTTGRVYSIIDTPSGDFLGRPRAIHAGAENSGIGGVATTDIEPEKIESYRIFDGTCSCQKPAEVRLKSTRGSTVSERVSKFEYEPGTKLLKKRTELNPATGIQPMERVWDYTYVQAKSATQSWGAWLPNTEATPDGTYTYHYSNWLDRADAGNHGRIAGTVERRIAGIRTQTTLTGGVTSSPTIWVAELMHRNLPNNPGGFAFQGPVRGMPRQVVDGDGVPTLLEYTSAGWLLSSHATIGDVKTTYSHNGWGLVTAMTENATSSTHAATTTYPSQSPYGDVYAATTSSGGLLRRSEYFHDRWGNLTVVRHNNLASDGTAPKQHGVVTSSARAWIEDQYHYHYRRLVEVFRDRQPVDEAADASQFLTTAYEYHENGRLKWVTLPNGARREYDFDGFGTTYREVTKDPTLTQSVTSAKRFVNPFLEVTGSYQSASIPGGTEHLWTTITRNGAGAITQIVEPTAELTAELGAYTGSLGGAVHQYDIDVMGRVIGSRVHTGLPATPTNLMQLQETRYDQLDRPIWQRDQVLGQGSGDQHVAWHYRPDKASQLFSVERTGTGSHGYQYLASGYLDRIIDSFGVGNAVAYEYHDSTPYLKEVTRTDLDPANPNDRVLVTAYDVDPFGRTLAVREGPAPDDLIHAYAYDSRGRVDRYTDPMGRVQEFLPDARGRLVAHVRVGDGSDYIHNGTTFVDFGDPVLGDGRTKTSRFDGLGNVTVEHYDFAGRTFIVQNPGGDVVPTATAKNQSMCLYAEFDEASRMKALYDGDLGKTRFWYDGGRNLIQRELVATGSNIATFNTKDVLSRNALGQITKATMFGASNVSGGVPVNNLPVAVEQFQQDSLGRMHEENYLFAPAPGNVVSARTSYTGGNPLRSGLEYLDGLTGPHAALSAPVAMQFGHDSIGRLSTISWDRAPGASGMQLLAEYDWVGRQRRSRTVHYSYGGGTTNPSGRTSYDYDLYGRLTGIQDVVTDGGGGTSIVSEFDYEYDAAGNLTKGWYVKAGGFAGDRFAYDAYHRLSQAWMGASSAVMAATNNPVGFTAGQMKEHLTYGIDAANNRTTTTAQTGASPVATHYARQDAAHSQGPSNRYATVGPTAAPVAFAHDDRGNLQYDGKFYYVYDYLNRLQQVWGVAPVGGAASSDEKYAVIEEEALDESRQAVENQLIDLMQRVPREHMDASFRARLKARLRGGVLRMSGARGGGGGMAAMPGLLDDADLELVAVCTYDAFNRRLMRAVVGVETTFFAWSGWQNVGDYGLEQSGGQYVAAPTKEYVWGSRLDELLSYRRRVASAGSYSWETYFVHHGGQDTATKLVDVGGNVIEQYEYDPYGKVSVYDTNWSALGSTSSRGLRFLYEGIRLDSESELLYMRNRHYSTTMGRFLTNDPLGGWADQVAFGNGYTYCGNNPASMSDPLGLDSYQDCLDACAAGAAIAMSAAAGRCAYLGPGFGGCMSAATAGIAAGVAACLAICEMRHGWPTLRWIDECLDLDPPPLPPGLPPDYRRWGRNGYYG